MATRWWVEHEGRRIEVEPESPWSGYIVRLFADGEQIGEVKRNERKLTVEGDGITVKTWVAWHGASIQRAELIPGDGEPPIPLEPAPGTRAARREAWAREHPGLYAARHAASGVGQVLIGLLGLAALLRFLPDISIDVDLPSIDLPLPSIDAPDVNLPDVTLPAWLRAFLASSRYWIPILIGIGLAVGEYERRRRHAQQRAEREAAKRDAAGEPAEPESSAANERDVAGEAAEPAPDAMGEREQADRSGAVRDPEPADVTRADRR